MLQILLMLLVLGVVFVNGWTDAPNAITCAVVTKSLSYRQAVRLAAVCNLAGILLTGLLAPSVTLTVSEMADFSSVDPNQGIAALCAAMLSIIIFAVVAWYFGIPTSESHALMAALLGASFAFGGKITDSTLSSWSKALTGLALSLILGYLSGWILVRLLGNGLTKWKGKTMDRIQIAGAAAMAFLHGAQDGQKFLAVFLIANTLTSAEGAFGGGPAQHLPQLVLIAVVMALGTAVGGRRIIYTVGAKMVNLQKHQGICADLGSSLCLLLATATGIPMSTTHTKTAAILGTGTAGKNEKANKGVVGSMITAWIVTFPVCGLLGYLLTSWLITVAVK